MLLQVKSLRKEKKNYPLGLDDEDVNLHVRKSTFEQVRLGKNTAGTASVYH